MDSNLETFRHTVVGQYNKVFVQITKEFSYKLWILAKLMLELGNKNYVAHQVSWILLTKFLYDSDK